MGHILVTGGRAKPVDASSRIFEDGRFLVSPRPDPPRVLVRSHSTGRTQSLGNTPFAMSTLRTSSLRWARLTRPP